MSMENFVLHNGTLSPPTASSSSSSRSSSSLSSNTPSLLKIEETMPVITKTITNEIREEVTTEIQNALADDINKLIDEYKGEQREIIKELVVSACSIKLHQTFDDLQHANEKTKTKLTSCVRKQTKSTIIEEGHQEMQEIFSTDWQDIATEYTEHITEDLETTLWSDMSSKLQDVYRLYRNMTNTLKVDKQASIDLTESRLDSLLTQVQSNNNERIRYLTNATQQYLQDQISRRQLEFQMHLELETRTLRRELAQIRQDAQMLKENKSTTCVLL